MEKDKQFRVRARGIILCEGKLLTVKHPHNTSFVALPGGHLEWGEDIKECLSREIREELGISPEIGRLLYVNNFVDGDSTHSIEFFFEITNSDMYRNLEGSTATHAHEIEQVCYLDVNSSIILLPHMLSEDFKAGKVISDEVRYITSS